jgi:hypothetical protein
VKDIIGSVEDFFIEKIEQHNKSIWNI